MRWIPSNCELRHQLQGYQCQEYAKKLLYFEIIAISINLRNVPICVEKNWIWNRPITIIKCFNIILSELIFRYCYPFNLERNTILNANGNIIIVIWGFFHAYLVYNFYNIFVAITVLLLSLLSKNMIVIIFTAYIFYPGRDL